MSSIRVKRSLCITLGIIHTARAFKNASDWIALSVEPLTSAYQTCLIVATDSRVTCKTYQRIGIIEYQSVISIDVYLFDYRPYELVELL